MPLRRGTRPRRRSTSILLTVVAGTALPLASLATGPIIARALGPEGRGHSAAVLAPVALVPLLLAVGQQDAGAYLVASRKHAARVVAGTVAIIASALAVLGIAALWVLAPILLRKFPEGVPLLRAVSFTVLPAMILNAIRGVRQGQGAYFYSNLARWAVGLTRLAIFVLLAIGGAVTVTTTAWAQVLAILLGQSLLLIGLGSKRVPGPSSRELVPAALRFGTRAWGGELALLVTLRLDQVVMLPLAGAEQLGYYVVAVSLAEVPQVLMSAARLVFFAESARRPDPGFIARYARLIPVLVGVPSAGAILLSPHVIPFLFGADFSPAVRMAQLLLAGSLPIAFVVVIGPGVSSAGRPGLNSMCQLAGLSTTIVAVIALVPHLGGVGAALASVGSYSVTAACLITAYSRMTALSIRDLTVLRRQDLRDLRRLLPGRRSPVAEREK